MESRNERLRVVDTLLSKPGPSAALFQDLKLDEVGAKACCLLLKSAIEHQQRGDWELCHEAALKAREYAWEQLHSGPSWQAVAQVHRDAYGVAGTLVALEIFLSGATDSLDKAVYSLDLVALMAGGRFQAVANLSIEHMEAHAQLGPNVAPVTSRAPPQAPQTPPDRKTTSCTFHETDSSGAAAAGLVPATPAGMDPIEPRLKKAKRGRSPGMNELPGAAGGVRRIRMPPLHVFQREYMETSTPVILTGVMDGWPALGLGSQGSRDWSNPSYLRAVAGRRTVPVELGGCYTSDGWRQELMTVGDFIGRFIEPIADDSNPNPSETGAPSADRTHLSADKARASAGTVHSSIGKAPSSSDRALGEEEMLDTGVDADVTREARRSARAGVGLKGAAPRGETAYLAQHELFDQIPPLRRDIMTPDYCALLLADEEDDGGAESVATNAWFGPGGTVSPLHNDPFHNLLAQVVGSKRVLLVDRKLSAAVYPLPGLMTNTSEVDAANPDLSKHPLFAEAMPLVECELRKGEMLYIPPLFWHHIESLEVSFSVSFWWGKRRALSEVLPSR